MHINAGYSYLGMYLLEARNRMYSYLPPYNGGYATPWLWYDGDPDGAYQYTQWQNKITARMNIPAPVTITMWGDWFPAQGTGTVYAQFRNDGASDITGKVLFVITEDSIHIAAPNGDQWHNHVARDYLPTHNGEIISIPAGDSATLSRTFALQPTWNPDMIEFVTWIQDLHIEPDSTYEIWQGGILDIDELGIEEYGSGAIVQSQITAFPNPASNATKFSFTLPDGEMYRINIYDITGRKVKSLSGIASGADESVEWNLRNEEGVRSGPGVYLYRFESPEITTSGKVVVQ